MSKRDGALAKLRNRYPDKNFDDDEAVFGQISDDYDSFDQEIEKYKGREQQFADMFSRDPRSAYFLTAWRDGEHPFTLLVREFGKEGLEEIVNNEDRMEEFAKANEEYLARVAKEKELEEEYQNNLQESLSYLDRLQAEQGLADEEVDEIMEFLSNIVTDGIVGKFSPESIEMAQKAINHDYDVTEADAEGEIRGRNARIEEKLRRRGEGDGTASLAGKNRTNGGPTGNPSNIFELADTAR